MYRSTFYPHDENTYMTEVCRPKRVNACSLRLDAWTTTNEASVTLCTICCCFFGGGSAVYICFCNCLIETGSRFGNLFVVI
jgi:hypothetical protein